MNTSGNISRKDFIRNSALAVAGLALPAGIAAVPSSLSHGNQVTEGKLSLKNVRLETGFEYDENGVVAGTRTDLFSIEIEHGKINRITPNQPGSNAVDAGGYLMLPAFKDMHIHLDKTFYGGQWQAVKKRSGVKEMIALEQQLLPGMLKDVTYRAEKLMALLQSKGTGLSHWTVPCYEIIPSSSAFLIRLALFFTPSLTRRLAR